MGTIFTGNWQFLEQIQSHLQMKVTVLSTLETHGNSCFENSCRTKIGSVSVFALVWIHQCRCDALVHDGNSISVTYPGDYWGKLDICHGVTVLMLLHYMLP